MLIHLKNDAGAIKRSHIMAFLAIASFICVIGYGYFRNVKKLIMAQETAELTTIANLKADQIVQWRKERLGDGHSIMQNSLIADRLRDYLEGSRSPVILEGLKVWMESLRTGYDYRSAALYGVDGRMLLAVHDAGTPLDLIVRQLVEQTVKKPNVYFSDFHRDEDSGSIHLNLVVPVGHTVGNRFKPLAVLMLDIDPHKFLYPLINKWPTASKSSETILLERSGDDALFLSDARLRPGTALSMRMPLARKEMPGVRAVLGQEAVFEGKDYNNAPVLAATRTIAGSPWSLVAKIDLAEIDEPLKARAWWVIIFCALLVLASGLGIYNWWSKQTVKTLKESDEKFRAVASHTYDWEYWKGVDGSILYCSPSCQRISGYTAEQFQQDPDLLIRLIHPDDRDRYKHNHDFDASGLAPSDCQSMDFRIHTASGEERWIAHVCQEIFDEQGVSLGRRACNRDITIRRTIEESLSASQTELQTIYDNAPVMLCLVNTERRVIYANHAFTLFTGIAQEGLEGGHACGVFGCANAQDDPRGCGHGLNCLNCSLIQTIDDTFKSGKPHQDEEHNFTIDRDGNRQNFTLLVSTVRIDSAESPRLLLCLQDISEHTHLKQLQQSEETLKRQNGLFASLLKNLSVGVFMVEVPSGKPLVANDAALELLGRGILPDATKDNLSHAYKAFRQGTHDPYPSNEMPIMIAMSGKSSHVDDMVVERPDGTRIQLEVYGSPIKDHQGHIWASLASFVDITAQKTAENLIKNQNQELEQRVNERTRSLEDANYELIALNSELEQRRQEAEKDRGKLLQLSTAVEHSPVTIVIADKLGNIEYVNPRFTEISGYLAEEAIGQNPRILKADNQPKLLHQELWETILRGEVWRGDFCNRKKNGDIFWEHASISPIRGEDGTITHYVAIKDDITEQRKLMEDLLNARDAADSAKATLKQKNAELEKALVTVEQAGRAKGEFLANMSHEIRTPLNAIIGFSALALKSPMPPRQQDFIGKIHTAGELLLNIINDILDFSKIEAGQMKMEQIPFRLNIIVENASSLVQQKALERGLNLHIGTPPDAASFLVGDPHRLSQIIVNLLNNAVKFTEHGAVRLETTALEQEETRILIKFSVHDTGIGISDEQLARLFRPFTQADGSSSRRFGGTGLGLTISKQLVENMGGQIWCESTPGHGSIFNFTAWFGLCQESDMEQSNYTCASPTDEARPNFDFSGSRVLLVEDNEINRQLALELLKDTGVALDVAGNGEEAVAMVIRGAVPYDLVLMDIQMPVMDGYEATRTIREDRRFASLPIIAMTAHALQEELQKILRAGMDAYITKPIDAKAMLRTMSVFLCGQGSSEHIFEKRENTTGNEVVIPDIEGLDVSGALYRLDGDKDLYLWLLRSFVENQTGIATLIEELLGADDTGQAARHIHTIKGIAGSIGAVALEELSRSLENAIAKGEPIAASLGCFTSELERLMTLLKSHLPVDPEAGDDALPGSVDVLLLTPILNRLQDHIRGRNGKAERYLESYQRELSGLPDKEVGQLKKHLGNFDFAAAHESLLALASRSGITLTS